MFVSALCYAVMHWHRMSWIACKELRTKQETKQSEGSVQYYSLFILFLLCVFPSIYFTINYYKDSTYQPLRGLFPSVPVVIALIASWVITSMSEVRYMTTAKSGEF